MNRKYVQAIWAWALSLCCVHCANGVLIDGHWGGIYLGPLTFGQVAMDERLALAADPRNGHVYVFDVGTKDLVSLLRPEGPLPKHSQFGAALAIDGELALVSNIDEEAVHVFNTMTGERLFKLSAPRADESRFFGWSVAIEGQTAVVAYERGQYLDVFDLSDGHWVRSVDTGLQGYNSGRQVALEGNLAAIGGYVDPLGNRDPHVSIVDILTGEQVRMLSPPRVDDWPYFGTALAMDRGRLAVGEWAVRPMYLDDGTIRISISEAGSATVDVFDIETGQLLHEFISDNPQSKDLFGSPVALSGDVLLVGAVLDTTYDLGQGAVHMFNVVTGERIDPRPQSTRRRPAEKLQSPLPFGGEFGSSIAAAGDYAIIGAPPYQAVMIPIPEPNTIVMLGVGLLLVTPLCRLRQRS